MFIHLDQATRDNPAYRNVIYTDPHTQIALMRLLSTEEIGMEHHPRTTQFIKLEEGLAQITIGRETHTLKGGEAVVIPPNTLHNVVNVGNEDLLLYTVYTGQPPHPPNTYEYNKILES
ncbi:MAG: cupin domain-containing protein [Nitrososphaerales archaeon]